MKKIKVAIIVDQHNYLNWHNAVVIDLINSKNVDVVLKLNFDNDIIHKKSLGQSLPFLWKLFLRIDAKFFKPKPDALTVVDENNTLNALPFFKINEDINIRRQPISHERRAR